MGGKGSGSQAGFQMRRVKCVPGPLETPCILWGGFVDKWGYGQVKYKGKTHRAHRLMFFFAQGHWPEVGRHKCDVSLCINVGHLEDGTVADNSRDMVERERCRGAVGERNTKAKLTEDDVRKIRALRAAGTPEREVAESFGISLVSVSRIHHRRSWRHVR